METLKGLLADEIAEFLSKDQNGRKNLDDSFYICDLGQIAKMYEKWKALLPRVHPFYAVKVAPHEPMIGALASFGAGFDCASQEEIDMVMQQGISPDLIIFSNPSKQRSHINHARKLGISTTVFDNEEEMIKNLEIFPSARFVMRIGTNDTKSDWGLSGRFGADMQHSKYLLQKAKELDVAVVGISFHVGSGCHDRSAFTSAIRDSRQLFDFAETLGMNFTLLDIGGGFFGVEETMIETTAGEVRQSLDEYFPADRFPSVRIVAEPGRYFAASTFTLATNIISKSVPFGESDVEVEYTVNEGKYGGLAYIESGGEFEAYNLQNPARKQLISKIWGPACDSGDVVLEKRLLPEMEVGEWLFWRNAGAYSFACASRFNGVGANNIYNVISAENEEFFQRNSSKREASE